MLDILYGYCRTMNTESIEEKSDKEKEKKDDKEKQEKSKMKKIKFPTEESLTDDKGLYDGRRD